MADLSGDERVAKLLDELAAGLTDPIQACLQGPRHAVRYEAASEFNSIGYEDRQGFEGFALQYADETKGMADLERVEKKGSELASMLYTYRSIGRALPTVSGSDTLKKSMYAASFEVLNPYIGRVKQLMYFKDDVVAKFCQNLALLVRVEKQKKADHYQAPCEGLMIQLMRTLDVLVVLDSIKDTKACLSNDFATYKRAFQFCRGDVPNAEAVTQENNLLQPFLANNESITVALKTAVDKVPGHEDVLAAMASLCVECLEQEWYLLPTEKHRLLRGAVYTIWLLDKPDKGKSAFKHKLIKKERFAKYLKRNPVVPLYGDMHANLQAVLQRCPNFAHTEAGDWISVSRKDVDRVRQAYDIIAHLPRLRVLVAEYIGSLNELLHRVAAMGGGDDCRLPREQHTDLAMRLTWCVLRGCRLMSLTNAQLMEFIAWKCAHMVDAADLARRMPRDYEPNDYEKALRFNLSDAERSAMVELLGLLKGLHSALHQAEGDPEIMIRRALHEQTQHFIHSVMGGPTRKAVKYDKKNLRATLMQLRNMVADWSDGIAIMDEEAMVSKDFKYQSHGLDYPPRSVPPSDTQLWLMRALVRSLYDEQSPYIKSQGLGKDPDLSKQTVGEMRSFYSSSALFPYLLQLPTTLHQLSNVSYLWLREFYLELCKRVQFPIPMSLPWILTEHVLNQRNRPLMPMIFAPMDAYNDAASDSLRKHQQQFLFVEIEAETNLCFDQILFNLAEQIYTHYKTRAALQVSADGRGPNELERGGDKVAARALGKNWYETLLSQRCVSLLGRSVDLAQLLAQRMNTMVRQSIETAVARFESKDITGVRELASLLRSVRQTHALLERDVPDIDAYAQAFMETNEEVTFLSFSSRINTHATKEILEDLLPNFAFRVDGNLFQRPPKTDFTQPIEREPAPKVTNQAHIFGTRQLNAEAAMRDAMLQGAFGNQHAEALVEVLGEGGMQQLLARLGKHMEDLLSVVGSYVAAMQEAMPANTKFPSHQYGAAGCFGYYEAKLNDLRGYEELHSGVMHNCRRLGNGVALLQLLEGATQIVTMKTLLQLPVVPQGGADAAAASDPLSLAATSVSDAWGQAPEESDMVLMAQQLSALCAPLAPAASLLQGVLVRLCGELASYKEAWLGGDTIETDMSNYETTLAFYRVWSAVVFLFCTCNVETAMGNLDNAMLFGEGLPMAGCLILHMLGQRHRYELFDFCYHTFAVHMSDTSGAQPDQALTHFLQSVSVLKRSNERMFTLLQALDVPDVYNVWRRLN